ncbi:nipped-B-like protein isoform X2 [Lineus longissimus]|uniref:nipped-B-like protein isoform X2 n=1 Tax=Lineus longissimus TaxID=88925 RepID=UPI002B4D7C36
MNGEIPSVPITTLAGVSSLTDLLPELPLPTPLPSTVNNKSLLFHPRIAEEAKQLTASRDESLVPTLAKALSQTTTEHIELKDSLASDAIEGDIPDLLKAILAYNPNVFKGKKGTNYDAVDHNRSPMAAMASLAGASPFQPPPTPTGQPSSQQHSPYQSGHFSPFSPNSPSRLPQQNSYSQHGSPYQAPTPQSAASKFQQQFQNFAAASQSSQFPQLAGTSSQLPVNGGVQASNTSSPSTSSVAASPPQKARPLGTHSTKPATVSSPARVPPTPPVQEPSKEVLSKRSDPEAPNGTSREKHHHHKEKRDKHHHPPEDKRREPVVVLEPVNVEAINANLKKQKLLEQQSTMPTMKGPVVRLMRLDPLIDSEHGRLKVKRKRSKSGEEYSVVSSNSNDTRLTLKLSKHRPTPSSYPEPETSHTAYERAKQLSRQHNSTEGSRGRGSKRKKTTVDYYEDAPSPSPYDERIGEFTLSMSERIKRRRRGGGGEDDEYVPEIPLDLPAPKEMPSSVSKDKKKKREKVKRFGDSGMSAEERVGSGTFKKFMASIESVLESTEEVDTNALDLDEDIDVPAELLIPRSAVSDLCSEAAKLKSIGVLNLVTTDKLVKLQNLLQWNIRDGTKILATISQHDDDTDAIRVWRELTFDRVVRSVDAALLSLYIMTSDNMPKQVFIEDVIEKICFLAKYQMTNSIFPEYDPVYRIDDHKKDIYHSSYKMKRARAHQVKHKSTITLYNKLTEMIGSLAELIDIQELTDTIILQASSLGVGPFFVENISELQLSAIKLVTTIFSKYEKHRALILEDIFASLARLPSSKRNLRSYRLNSDESIQMVTALVLQLIQSVAILPEVEEPTPGEEEAEVENRRKALVSDSEVVLTSSYETAMRCAHNFLSVYLKKCTIKGEEDYRPLFENFVQDLLSTVNKPEWPAAELLLSLLGRLLVRHFSNKSVDMALRVASLDYLGIVAARLRKDALSSQLNQETVDEILQNVRDDNQELTENGRKSPDAIPDDKDHTQLMQKALLDYLMSNANDDPVYHFARQFYIAQWYRDSTTEAEKVIKRQHESSSSTDENDDQEKDETVKEMDKQKDILQRAEGRKVFLISHIQSGKGQGPFATYKNSTSSNLDYENACLCVRYLASNRPFSQSFDIYLTQILKVLSETAVAVRTKAMKCLTAVIEADPGILARSDMQRGVHGRLLDQSTSVREAAVELVGKFILIRPELTSNYYDMLSDRILDTGISVRKRVIKIFRDICLEQPDFPKVPEMCVKMIRRVNDEEGIKKLVTEVFQSMWFTAVRDKDSHKLVQKVINIADVVAASRDSGYDWIEQLLENLLRKEEDLSQRPVEKACIQIVNCLVENVLELEERSVENDGRRSVSQRLVACLSTLHLFCKIKPELMVDRAFTIQPYLDIKCNNQGDYLVIHNVAKILELVIPLMDHPSEGFLAQVEEDMMKLILKHGMMVLQSCVSCLGAIVNMVSHNYKLVTDCFRKFFGVLSKLMAEHQRNHLNAQSRPTLLRSLFTIGLLCQHFDFDSKEMGEAKVLIRDRVFEILMYFTEHDDEDIRHKALTGLGFLCIRYYDFMLETRLKEYYKYLLVQSPSIKLKCQVLRNLETYLKEEEIKMIKADHEWRKRAKGEDLKEMGDIQSGMASTVMQIYLKETLESFFHANAQVRFAALSIVSLVLRQGLVHPVQCVPYLVAMGTDTDNTIRVKADQQLQEIDKKYPGFIHMKSLQGIKMSYRLQVILQNDQSEPIRGIRYTTNQQSNTTSCTSLNSFLYSVVRSSRQQRRAILTSLLNLFDDSSNTPLPELLYLADNLANFPYQCHDEPLFIIHQIDIVVSVSGSNIIQSFREQFFPEKINENGELKIDDEEDEDNRETLISRVPDNAETLQQLCTLSQGCILLLVVKHHLKEVYGFTDSKIHRYSPNDASKMHEKPVNRKGGFPFEATQALEILRKGKQSTIVDQQGKENIAEEYLDFKYLMMSIDPADSEDDEEASKIPGSGRGTPLPGARTPTGGESGADGAEPEGQEAETMEEGEGQTEVSNHASEQPVEKHMDHLHHSARHVHGRGTPVAQTQPHHVSRHSYLLEKRRSAPSKSRQPKPHNTPRPKPPKRKKPQKKRSRRISDSEEEDGDDVDSDPDFIA